MGNLFSVKHACRTLGYEATITNDAKTIEKSDAIILPGVGAFGEAMQSLRNLHLIAQIKEFINLGKPFMGICLGFQLLFTESEEFGNYNGLDIFKGSVKKFPQNNNGKNIKVPQIGWNRIYSGNNENLWGQSPLKDIKNREYMYFIHSFFVNPEEDSIILSRTSYEGFEYCSSIKKDNVFACQFHPEKSGLEGLKIYKDWLAQ